jgi:hypothetical protein
MMDFRGIMIDLLVYVYEDKNNLRQVGEQRP